MSYKNTNLDFYDDRGETLRAFVPSISDIPDFVKTASSGSTPGSDDYALVILENGSTSNKFNISDAGNTWLSSLYYSANREYLPAEAQKVASTMIKAASEAYGIPVTSTIQADSVSYDLLETNVVDLTGIKPRRNIVKEAGAFALGSKYPINTAQQIKTAQEYFKENVNRFDPYSRREYAVKVAHAAESFGLPLEESIQSYSGNKYSSDLENHLAVRYSILQKEESPPEVRDSLIKVASMVTKLPPHEFAEALSEFDSATGLNRYWDNGVMDPWYSTFCIEKVAMGMGGLKAKLSVGDMTITEEELKLLSQDMRKLRNLFGEEFALSFSKDPVSIFKSMPLPQKKVIARMATDTLGTV